MAKDPARRPTARDLLAGAGVTAGFTMMSGSTAHADQSAQRGPVPALVP